MSVLSNIASHRGKTAKDKANGSHARRIQNLQIRGDWCAHHKKEEGLSKFPFSICNGKQGRRWKRWLKMN